MTEFKYGALCPRHPELKGQRYLKGSMCPGCAKENAARRLVEKKAEVLEYKKEYRQRAEVKQRDKENRKGKKRVRVRNRTPRDHLRRALEKRSKELAARGLPTTVTLDEAFALFAHQGERCAYTGFQLTFHPEKTASLDRINSDKGYTLDNIQWVHKIVNIAKNSQSHEEFIAMCYAVVSHHLDALDPTTKEQYKMMLFPT